MLIEYWLWRYKDPVTGQVCKTTEHMTADEAGKYPRAQRIPGSLMFRDIEVDFSDPTPRVFFPKDT